MSLPDCTDLGGEAQVVMSFCPARYLVPYEPDVGVDGSWGLLAGCIWGDDSTWKVQYLDLSGAAQGRITRSELFGSIELQDGLTLAEATRFSFRDRSRHVTFKLQRTFDLKEPDAPYPW